MLNAGMISLVFPFAVFGYALMEEERPGKKFWDFAMKYTLFVLFMKFIIQLDWYVFAEDLAYTLEEYSVILFYLITIIILALAIVWTMESVRSFCNVQFYPS
jgi:uncharacterized membrane protein